MRLPTFYQLDLRAERRFLFDAFTLDVYVEVVNATANRMVYGLNQNPTTGAVEQYSLRLFLPSLGVRGQMLGPGPPQPRRPGEALLPFP